jgi:hypothetical protein
VFAFVSRFPAIITDHLVEAWLANQGFIQGKSPRNDGKQTCAAAIRTTAKANKQLLNAQMGFARCCCS